MDNSDSRNVKNDKPSQQHVLTRAIFSAAVFGTLGALFGRWLGKRGNDRETEFAESVMTWSMGLFSGLLAAYSSFKASEHGTDAAARPAHTKNEAAPAPSSPISSVPSSHDTPGKIAQAGASEHEGKLHAGTAHIALEK